MKRCCDWSLATYDGLEPGGVCSDKSKGKAGGRSEAKEAKLLPDFQKLTDLE